MQSSNVQRVKTVNRKHGVYYNQNMHLKIFADGQVSRPEPKRARAVDLIPSRVRIRLLELHQLLSSYDPESDFRIENIHWVAILGSVARVFEALDKPPHLQNLLTKEFKQSVRRLIYHGRGPFALVPSGEYVDGHQVVSFFKHCYEHCRTELNKLVQDTGFPSMEEDIDPCDRSKPLFGRVINMGSIWVDDLVKRSEKLDLALQRLNSNMTNFALTIKYLENGGIELFGPKAKQHLDIIIGNYIGTEIAWLSCDEASIRTKRAPPGLKAIEPQHIITALQEFEVFGEIGKQFRHRDIPPQKFLKEISPELYLKVQQQRQRSS